jgi:CO/xanthine dehydrogenase Mo-binding subunit
MTDYKDDQIHIHLTFLGGGFGRRGEIDFIAETLEIAQATNKPIKLIWSREEDTTNDFYRPVALTRYRIGVDESGLPTQWHNQLASPSIFERIFKLFAPGFLSWVPFTRIIDDPVAVEGMKEIPYLDEPEFEYLQSKLPVPVGFWRSVGNSYSGFFTESVIDELAYLANQDPFEYRMKTMHDERAKKVLETAASSAKWGRTDVKQGIAFHKSFGSYVAEVVDLTISEDKEITLHKITIAIDCGIVVNPDTVKAQMEGGMIFGLVAAAEGEINFEQGETVQKNFDTYPMLRMYHTPEIEVLLVPSGDAPGGVGEPATPPIAAALTNAIYAATGERLRTLPIKKAGYRIGNRA